jgi:cytochrome c nitrite reductase small subunit
MAEITPKSRSPGAPTRFLTAAPLGVLLLLAGLFGGIVGLGGFTFTYAQGFSYLSNDPKACVNCHVMREVYDGWNHGTHKAVAVCNDCHTPHDLVGKYAVKALNGFRHSSAFTLGGFPEPIEITPFDRKVALDNCLRCHEDLVFPMAHASEADATDCLRCHSGVGHGR